MDHATLFSICNFGVLPFWLLLVVAPGARITKALVHSPLVPTLLGLVYAVVLFGTPAGPEEANMASLGGVAALFRIESVVLAGWVHYLIFDLFVGAWEVRDARRRGIPHIAVVPCLAGTLFAGPVGLMAYLGLRFAMRRVASLVEVEEVPAGST